MSVFNIGRNGCHLGHGVSSILIGWHRQIPIPIPCATDEV